MPMFKLKGNGVEAIQLKAELLGNNGDGGVGDYIVQIGEQQLLLKKDIFESIFEQSKNGNGLPNGNGNGHAGRVIHRGPPASMPRGDRYMLFREQLAIVTDMDSAEILTALRKYEDNQHVKAVIMKYGLDAEDPRTHPQIATVLRMSKWTMNGFMSNAEITVRNIVNGEQEKAKA